MTSAWNLQNQINGLNVIVAVIDTGYIQHPDLTTNIVSDLGYDLITYDQVTKRLRKPIPGGFDLK